MNPRAIFFSIIGLLFFPCREGWGQADKLSILSTNVDEIQLEFGTKGNQYALLSKKHLAGSKIVSDITLKNGDLIITYNLPTIGLEQYFDAKVAMVTASKPGEEQLFRPYPENLYGEYSSIKTPKEEGHQIVWSGITQQIIPFSGTFHFELALEGHGERPVACDKAPQFELQQKLPHYLGGAAAGLMIAASFIIEPEADRIYEDYKAQTLEEAATPLFEDANKKRHTYLILRYGGLGVAALDALWFHIRKKKYEKNMDYYNKYCGLQIQLGVAELSIKYNF